ncbi:MAG TPA: ABC transporter permease [Terriglobales bacterium]|jgi:phospholipid/cholesterol/gamma-HCH transport system permease protein
MAAGDFLSSVELISPSEFAKGKILAVQNYVLLCGQALGNLFRRPLYGADIIQQADFIGWGSISIVVLAGFFTGAVLAQNSASTLERFGSVSLIGQLVSVGMVRQLGPVITGLMVAGRNASGIASELGSMKVTEQIDAMRALGTDPTKKLVTPRVVATVTMLFFLTIIADLFGIVGGSMVAILMLGLDSHQYWTSSWQVLQNADVITGLIQPVFYGFVISTIGCYYGMTAKGGTQGVGRGTTQAVVVSSVLIVVIDFFLTRVLSIVLVYR